LMQLIQQLKENQAKVADLDTDLTLTSHQKELEESKLALKRETLQVMSKQAERFAAWEAALEKRIELTATQVQIILQDRLRLSEEAVKDKRTVNEIENDIIKESGKQDQIKSLLKVISAEKQEGEKVADYERRVIEEASKVLEF